jgi:hypothetical protein
LKTPFKICSYCEHVWPDKKSFLDDPAIELVGYQVNFDNLGLGLFLFNHNICHTTISIQARHFTDLYDGPVYALRKTGSEECPGHCLHHSDLEACPVQCECAFVREAIQILREWPKISTFDKIHPKPHSG